MPQAAVAGIGAWIGAHLAVVAITVVTALVNYNSAKGDRKSQKRRAAALANMRNGYLVNSRSNEEPVRVVYGQCRVGGNQVYVNARGTSNDYLDVILTVSEGPIGSIESVWLNDKLIGTFGSKAYYEFFNGAGDQAVCSTLKAADPDWDDYLRWTSYLYLRLTFDRSQYNGMPSFTAELKGRLLYDPRDATTAWSNNPALVWYDFMTNPRYGLGVSSDDIDEESVKDAANWCDTNSYTFNGVLWEKQEFIDALQDIMRNFRGFVAWSDGKYQLKIFNYDTPVMSFDEDEILTDSFSLSIPGMGDTANRVKVEYPDLVDNYVTKDMTVADATAVLQYDLEERDMELDLIGTTNATQARKLATYTLERNILNKTIGLTVHQRAIALEPGDLIQVTHTTPGWTDKVLRVSSIVLTQDGFVHLVTQEEESTLYDDIINISSHTYFSTDLPDPLDIPAEVTGVTFLEEEYFNKDVSYTRLKITFDAPSNPFWNQSQVWISIDGAGYHHSQNTDGAFNIEPVKEGVQYKVKLISESIHGVFQDWDTATEWPYGVIGKNTPPNDVTNFKAVPQADTVVLMWDGVDNIDLLGYLVRKGANWENGVFIDFKKGETVQLNGVSPGTHTYMIKSVDTNGTVSTNYELASATVYGPPTYTETMSEYNDFSDPSDWIASTPYSLGDRRLPTTPNGYEYECTSAGTSDSSEPTWPTANGGTVADGGATWTCYETHVFTNTERYNDGSHGWVLRGARDTVGGDLVTNGGFDSDTTGWTATSDCTVASIAGGQSGNCLELTRVSGDSQECYQDITTVVGVAYKLNVYLKSGTSGDEAFTLAIEGVRGEAGTTSGSWVQYELMFLATSTTSRIQLIKDTATAGTMLFDTAAMIEVDIDGTYVSPVYDRGSTITRRAWPEFDLVFVGTGTVWTDQFESTDLWTDKFSGSDSWLALFGPYSAGSVVMELGYSTDGSSWTWLPYFESYVNEVQARFIKYKMLPTDVDPEGHVYVKAGTYKEAYKI